MAKTTTKKSGRRVILKEIDRDSDIEPGQSSRHQTKILRRVSESIFPFANPDAGTEYDDRNFRQIGQEAGSIDLPPQLLQTAQRLSMLLYRKNVRAYRSVENLKDFVIGDGVKFIASDDRVQEILEDHWEQNSWEEKLPERLRALSIFGEQLYPAFRSEETGLVRLGAIIPFQIKRVNTNPENADELITVSVFDSFNEAPGAQVEGASKIYTIVRRANMNPELRPAFFWAVNRVSGSTRGVPDSLSAVDWLEGMDGFTFSLMERAALSENVVFDLEYEGLRADEIRKKVSEFASALKSGGIYGHNEKVKLNLKSPNLAASDAETVQQVLLRQIQAGTGFAGMYYGDSADLTRASASELAVPVAKMIQARQNFVRQSLALIFDYQIESSKAAGILNDVEDFSYEIAMPRVYLRDTTQETQSLTNLTNSLVIAKQEGWITDDEAEGVFKVALDRLGPLVSAASQVSQETKKK